MHQEPAQPRPSSSATGKREVRVHSRSMARGGSMNDQHLAIGADTDELENEVLLVPARKTAQRTKENDQPADQASFSLSGTIFAHLPSFITNLSPTMSNNNRTHKENGSSSSAEQSFQQLQSNEHRGEGVQSAKQNAINISRESLDGIVEGINKHHAAREEELGRQVRDLQRQNDNSKDLLGKLQAQTKQLESEKQELEFEKQIIEGKHNTFILKQQEMTFSQMPSSRWAPVEDSKVMEDLDRLKRDMRSWAKKVSANDLDAVEKPLGGHQQTALIGALKRVIIFDNNGLPPGLSSRKAPGLLLNALLSHSVYKSLFRNPFFFLGKEEETLESKYRVGLEGVYSYGNRSREEDAHIWRSQTLRLLLPPLATDTSEEEKKLRVLTEEMIFKVADREASIFLEGAAQYLMDNEALAKFSDKLYPIYREAAIMSYNLWARRTKLVCRTLHGGMRGRPVFHPNSKEMIAHSSVDYDSHADQLKGKAISIILHPCLKVYGTDDGKDYHQGRVWAPAEVWLDSRKPSAE
ncbi:hypothetical protein OCU04_013031 [Sclerotinia nivalis]|uniref:Uncharacterized protein n=1 Tax=Sclerotinia nivalis TaxID=352851 RepID=A0A9X0A7U3_9HELO|nr:hypothetical protein OCU04_013031 [Sclerotinia nivalis]